MTGRALALALVLATAAAAPASGAIEVQAVPAVDGIRLSFDGQVLRTDRNGRALVPAADRAALRARLRVLPTTVRHGIHAHFLGWRHRRLAITLAYQVRVLFIDPAGRHVDPSRIDAATLKGPGGVLQPVAVGRAQWLAGNRIVALGRRPVSRPVAWAVERVVTDGADVVARAQQRFVPARTRHPRVHTRFYRLRFSVSDALLGSAIGSEIRLRYPGGRTVRHPLAAGGQFGFRSLPRGNYTVSVTAPGLAKTWPVTLSGDTRLDVKVISYLDVLLVLGGLLVIAVALLLVGRRRARRAVA